MKKLVSGILSAVMLFGSAANLTVSAFDGTYEITADKTAQWKYNSGDGTYDLRIHGYREWETAAYMAFSLPEGFTSENLVAARLELYTVSYNKAGTAYLYSADCSSFENGGQYTGTEQQPAYNEEQILSFDAPAESIDILDYMQTLETDTEEIAFRIDVKSQSTNNKWVIGSCNNGYQAPKLILEYDDPDVVKSDVTVNIMHDNEILASYNDRVTGVESYRLKNEQMRYIRKNDDIYYFPENGQTEYDINGDTVINVPFEKLSIDGLVFFEDFTAASISELSEKGISAVNAEISSGALDMYDGGVLTLPDINKNNGMDLSFDFIGRDGSVFTLRNAAGEVICSFGADDTKRHNVSVTIKDGVFSVYIDGGLIQNGECDGSAVKSITVAEGGFIDALAIAAENIIYDGIVKNSDFSGGADVWTTEGNAYVTDDMSGTFMIMKESSSIAQTIEGIESGTYDIHARVKSDNMSNIGYVYAKAEGHPIMKTSLSVTTYDKDGEWRDIYIRGVNIDSGKCEIGAALEQLDADEVRVYPNIPDEPLPDGKGEVEIKNIDFVKSDSNDTFLVGGDINWLSFLEDKGVQYFDTDGTEKDAIQIMAENGANIVRLRLYNDPGKGHGDGVDYLPDGYQDPEDILDLARRAKDKGMQIQLTFHYSDYWSNAETQLIPHEWQEEIDKLGPDATQEEKDAKVEELLYNFTKDNVKELKTINKKSHDK